MPDDKMPESKPTTAFPAVPPWAIELMGSFKAFTTAAEVRSTKIEDHLTSQDEKLEHVVTAGVDTNVRLDRVETGQADIVIRVVALEGRAGKTSIKVGTVSQSDMEQSAQLAQERAAREALAAKVENMPTKEELKLTTLAQTAAIVTAIKTDPSVQKAIAAVSTTIAVILGIITTWLVSKGHP